MDRRTFIAALGATSALAFAGGFPARALAQAAPQPATGGADAQLAALLDRIFYNFMETSPEFATQLGLDTGPRAALRSQLSDFSAASQARDLAAFRGYERELEAMDRAALSDPSALHYDTVRFLAANVVRGLAGFPYGSNSIGYSPYVISQQDGAYQFIPDFLDQHHRVANAADADAYLARLEAFGRALDDNSEKQRQDAARGVFAPNFCLATTLDQMRALRSKPAAESILVTSIVLFKRTDKYFADVI